MFRKTSTSNHKEYTVSTIKRMIKVGAALTMTASLSAMAANNFNPAQVKNIQDIVHQYLVSQPQVLVEASEALRMKAAKKEQDSAMKAIKENTADLFAQKGSPSFGNDKPTVKLVEFFDYQCGHCKAMEPIVEDTMKNNKGLQVIYKELPIFGGSSALAAKAALAANMQGKYLAFHEALMKTPNPLDEAKIMKVAKSVGLNIDQLKKDMKGKNIDAQVKANFELAQKLQLVGTPAFVISNEDETTFRFIPGGVDEKGLQKAIDSVKSSS